MGAITMNQQDDLDKDYKAVSNEQPSEQADQLILQAAADAVAPEDTTKTAAKDNFSSRRWHMPVSIAAAAVITVSVVSSLKPWAVSMPASSEPEMIIYEEAEFDTSAEQYQQVEAKARTEQIAKRKKSESNKQRQQTIAADKVQRFEAPAPPPKSAATEVASPAMLFSHEPQKPISPAKELYLDSFDEVVSENLNDDLTGEINSVASVAKQLKQGQIPTKVEQSLITIEQHIAADNFDMATSQLSALLGKHKIKSFSLEQQERIKLIQQHLKSTGIHQ